MKKHLIYISLYTLLTFAGTAVAAPIYTEWMLGKEYGRLESKYNFIIGEELPRLENIIQEAAREKKELDRIGGIAKCKMTIIEEKKRMPDEGECVGKK